MQNTRFRKAVKQEFGDEFMNTELKDGLRQHPLKSWNQKSAHQGSDSAGKNDIAEGHYILQQALINIHFNGLG